MSGTKHELNLKHEQDVLQYLSKGEYTLDELAQLCSKGYYTVMRTVNNLLAQNKIIQVRIENRKRVFAVNKQRAPDSTIPFITSLITRQRHKSINLLEEIGHEDEMASVLACKEIPELVTLLFDLANTASHNLIVTPELNLVRQRMQRNYLTLKNAAFIYEQILGDSRFWNEKELKSMVNDVDYVPADVLRAKAYYEKDG